MKISASEYQSLAKQGKISSPSKEKNTALLAAFEDYIFKYGEFITEDAFKNGKEGVIKEYKFMPNRKFRIDYYITWKKIAIEIEGINYNKKSRHRTEVGYQRDIHKYNYISQAGIILFRFSYQDLEKEFYKEFL